MASSLCFTQDLALPPEQPLQPAAQPAPVLATVHGVVRNAVTGEPLPRALVRIEGDAEAGALTDGEGRFELPGVPIGPLIIRIRKPGFQDRPYATEDVSYQGDGPAHSVLVAAEMLDLDFKLTPTSAIHGHIELSTGDPAEGIRITLLKQAVRNGRAVWTQNGGTKTNGSGAYRFANLPAGVYALFTQPTLESEAAAAALAPEAKVTLSGYPTVFYPEAREFTGATRIRLAAGQQTEANLLLTLEPFYAVKATAILPNGKPLTGNGAADGAQLRTVLILDAAGRQLAYTVQFNEGHGFQANLPDGSYSLLIHAQVQESNSSGRNGSVVRNPQNQEFLAGFAEFSVEGHAVSNLQIPLSSEPGWPIQLHIVRTAAPTSVNTNLSIDSLVTVWATDTGDALMGNADGPSVAVAAGPELLEMNGAGPGLHWIDTQVNDRSLCVDSFSAGGVNLAREPLNVALGSSPPPMEIALSDNCAKLALTLPPAFADFLPGDEPFYTVYVVPDFDTTADIPPMSMHPSSGATLTVDGLRPGSYHVYVFNEPMRLEYRNSAVLAALPTPGQQVTVSAGVTSNLMLEVPGQ